MRAEDKEVDGRDLERAEKLEASELEKQDDEEVEDLVGDEVRETTSSERRELIAAMRQILERQHIVVNDLRLPRRELRALDALKAAVEGRDPQLDQFVYATDRSDLLEQALAILQPNIGDITGFEDLISHVAHLRHGLKELEDAQDELIDGHGREALAKADAETADKPKPKPDDTSLTGPARELAKPASSLTGPELAPEPAAVSTLSGPEPKAAPKPASTLTGPELAPEPVRETTLGDPAELAETAKKQPWWRRPSGG